MIVSPTARLLSLFGQFQESGIQPAVNTRFIRRLRRRIEAGQNGRGGGTRNTSAQDALARASELAECYEVYSAIKAELGLLDMGDLTMKLLHLLKTDTVVGRTIAHRYDHFLVDEFQDLSPIQLKIVRALWELRHLPHHADAVVPAGGATSSASSTAAAAAGAGVPSLLAVGDENQAIFGWRFGHLAGTTSAIAAFGRAYPAAPLKSLSVSYRCKQAVLDAASAVISGGRDGRSLLQSARSRSAAEGEEDVFGTVAVETFDALADETNWVAVSASRSTREIWTGIQNNGPNHLGLRLISEAHPREGWRGRQALGLRRAGAAKQRRRTHQPGPEDGRGPGKVHRRRQPVLPAVGANSRRRDCQFADTPFPSILKRLLQGEGGCSKMTVSPTARCRSLCTCSQPLYAGQGTGATICTRCSPRRRSQGSSTLPAGEGERHCFSLHVRCHSAPG